jgi:hypothetical protein
MVCSFFGCMDVWADWWEESSYRLCHFHGLMDVWAWLSMGYDFLWID